MDIYLTNFLHDKINSESSYISNSDSSNDSLSDISLSDDSYLDYPNIDDTISNILPFDDIIPIYTFQDINDSNNIPHTFKLLTYNISCDVNDKIEFDFFKMRKTLLVQTIENSRADIIFLQNTNNQTRQELQQYGMKYKYTTPVDLAEFHTYALLKFMPNNVKIYSNAKMDLIIIEFKNLVIFNVNLKTKSNTIFKYLHNIMKSKYLNSNIILCGDIYWNLNSDIDIVDKFKPDFEFIDTYKILNPADGFTYDINTNYILLNANVLNADIENDIEQKRSTTILFNPSDENNIDEKNEQLKKQLQHMSNINVNNWSIIGSKLIGTEYEYLNYEDSKWYFENVIKVDELMLVKDVKTDLIKNEYYIPINPSNNYGLMTIFKDINREQKELKQKLKQNSKNKQKTPNL